MKDVICSSAYFGFVISILAYYIGTRLKKKYKLALLNPLLVAMVLVIAALVIFRIDYDSYNTGARYISYLLTPATVCLAIPLYQQLELLKHNLAAVLISITAGVLASLGSIFLLSLLFGLNSPQYITLLPKSITTAIGISLSEELGGIPNITMAAIIITGILGNMIGEAVCKAFRIRHPIAVGLAFGTASHAIGTSKALELGEIEGAMGSLSIAVSGLITVLTASVFANFI
ncbi:MAG: LrgB family protein [Lachnospiraceae bacterium]|nr:LrgB family protein [Lachnospiraceae bacterium]